MSLLNLKSRSSIETSYASYDRASSTKNGANASSISDTNKFVSNYRNYSPTRPTQNDTSESTMPNNLDFNTFRMPLASAPMSSSSPSMLLPAATVLKVELEHAKTMNERYTDQIHSLEKDKRALQDQVENLKREARDGRDNGFAEWRKRLAASTDECEKLRSDLALSHEEIASLKASMAESKRLERRHEGMSSKLQDAEDALLRQEMATSELRKAKQAVEKELDEIRRSNPTAVFKSKIQQLELDLEAREAEIRRKQEDILTITKQHQSAVEDIEALKDRLHEEERKSALLQLESANLTRRLSELEQRLQEREVAYRKTVGDLESSNRAAQQRAEAAQSSRDIAEQTLSTIQRENKRGQQGMELHLAQRAAEIESLNKQLDVYKSKMQDLTRDLQEAETRAANDRRIRDGIESELSRERIINQDLQITSERSQKEVVALEKDNDLLYAQINNLNTRVATLSEEKLTAEKSLESASIKIEIAARVAADLESVEKTLNEKRAYIATLETKVRTLEPYETRVAALTTMNESLQAEVVANRQELATVRLALDEEKDSHTRTSNKIRILEAKLLQSNDRHEELFNKLKTLELVQSGDRSSQLAGTFAALHEKISSADSDHAKVFEANAVLFQELKAREEAMKEQDKQLSRAREITREAEMARVQAEVARDEAFDKLAAKEKELVASSDQQALYSPFRIEAERKSYSETIDTLQGHLAFEKKQAAQLKQEIESQRNLSAALDAQRALNHQFQRELARISNVNTSEPPSAHAGLPEINHQDVESIHRSLSTAALAQTKQDDPRAQTVTSPNSTSTPKVESRNISPYRAPVVRTQEPSPTRHSGEVTPAKVDDSLLKSMQQEINDLRTKAQSDQSQRDNRIEVLSNTLAEAISEMKHLRASRAPKSPTANTKTPAQSQPTLGRMGSGIVTAAHRALTGPTMGISPLRQRQQYEEDRAAGVPESPNTSPYREVGAGGVVMATSPKRTLSPSKQEGIELSRKRSSTKRPNTSTTVSVQEVSPRVANGNISPTIVARATFSSSGKSSNFAAPTAASRAKAQPGSSSPSLFLQRGPTPRGISPINKYGSEVTYAPRATHSSIEYDDGVHVDPSQLDDEELLKELEAAKKRMKKVLLRDRMVASPAKGNSPGIEAGRARY